MVATIDTVGIILRLKRQLIRTTVLTSRIINAF